MVKEKIGGRDALRLRATSGVAQIEYELFRSLFLQVANLAGDLLRLAFRERVHLNVADIVSEHFFGNGRDGDRVARDHNLLGFRPPRPHNCHCDRRSDLARQETVNLSQRHVVCGLALDGFNDVGVLDTGLIRRASGNHGDHRSVSEALRDGGADIGLAVGLHRLVVLVLGSRQVAGIGVERLQQTVQRALGDPCDIGLLNIFEADARQHFAVNG